MILFRRTDRETEEIEFLGKKLNISNPKMLKIGDGLDGRVIFFPYIPCNYINGIYENPPSNLYAIFVFKFMTPFDWVVFIDNNLRFCISISLYAEILDLLDDIDRGEIPENDLKQCLNIFLVLLLSIRILPPNVHVSALAKIEDIVLPQVCCLFLSMMY